MPVSLRTWWPKTLPHFAVNLDKSCAVLCACLSFLRRLAWSFKILIPHQLCLRHDISLLLFNNSSSLLVLLRQRSKRCFDHLSFFTGRLGPYSHQVGFDLHDRSVPSIGASKTSAAALVHRMFFVTWVDRCYNLFSLLHLYFRLGSALVATSVALATSPFKFCPAWLLLPIPSHLRTSSPWPAHLFTIRHFWQSHLHIASSIEVEVGLFVYETELYTLLRIHANIFKVQPCRCRLQTPIATYAWFLPKSAA